MKKLVYPILLISLVFLFDSCFKRLVLSDKQIEERYAQSSRKPKSGSYFYNSRKLHYMEAGSDSLPTVIFIHGAPGAWYGYIEYIDDTLLQTKYNLVSVDRPGYGKSDYGKSLTSITQQAEALKPLLESKKKTNKKVILVGRSYGCPIAAKAAAEYPELVDGILLLAPAMDPKREKFWWFSSLANSKVVRAILPKMLNVASDEKFSHAQELKNIENDLVCINQSVVLMQGMKDQIIDPENVCYVDSMLVNAKYKEVVTFDDCDHFISRYKPQKVKEAIDALMLDLTLNYTAHQEIEKE